MSPSILQGNDDYFSTDMQPPNRMALNSIEKTRQVEGREEPCRVDEIRSRVWHLLEITKCKRRPGEGGTIYHRKIFEMDKDERFEPKGVTAK